MDFRSLDWGHNIQRTGNGFAAWCTPRLNNGDVIHTNRGRFIVYNVRPCDRPKDMVFFNCIREVDSLERAQERL